MPVYGGGVNHGVRRTLEHAHEQDATAWKRAFSHMMHSTMEGLDRTSGQGADLVRRTMALVEELERVADVHEKRVATLCSEKRQAQGRAIIRSRMGLVMKALAQKLKADMRSSMTGHLAMYKQDAMRGATDACQNRHTKDALAELDERTALDAADALRSINASIVRRELDRWSSFLSGQYRSID